MQQPQDVAVMKGDTVRISCNGTSVPGSRITWFKNDQQLNNSNNIDTVTINSYVYSVLTIYNSTTKDQGSYQCNYTNMVGSNISKKVNVTVYSKYNHVYFTICLYTFEGLLT